MSTMTNIALEYVDRRISRLKQEVAATNLESPISGTLVWEMKSSIHELEQVKAVLEGGQSVFDKAREITHEPA